eukprot:UN23147
MEICAGGGAPKFPESDFGGGTLAGGREGVLGMDDMRKMLSIFAISDLDGRFCAPFRAAIFVKFSMSTSFNMSSNICCSLIFALLSETEKFGKDASDIGAPPAVMSMSAPPIKGTSGLSFRSVKMD